jgi:predicted metal-dependent peptidase
VKQREKIDPALREERRLTTQFARRNDIYIARLLAADNRSGFGCLAYALLSLIPIETRLVPTMAVDQYWRLYINPEFLDSLTPDQAAMVLVHEVWHLLLEHHYRSRAVISDGTDVHSVLNRHGDLFIWNLACFPAGTLLPGGEKIEDVATMSRPFKGNLVRLTAQAGTVEATPEHPFFAKNGLNPKRSPNWVEAGKLVVGDYLWVPSNDGESKLLGADVPNSALRGAWCPIKKIEEVPFEGTVYNMTTESHTYVANGYLVHNCDAEINQHDDLLKRLPDHENCASHISLKLPPGLLAEQYFWLLKKNGQVTKKFGQCPKCGTSWVETRVRVDKDQAQTPQSGGESSGEKEGQDGGQESGGGSPGGQAGRDGGQGSGDGSSEGQAGQDSGQGSGDSSSGKPSSVGCPNCGCQNGKALRGDCGSGVGGHKRDYELPTPTSVSGKKTADGHNIPGIGEARGRLVAQETAREIREMANKNPGSVPGNWVRWADRTLTPQVDWRSQLRQVIHGIITSKSGYVYPSYRRPSRRAHVCPEIVRPIYNDVVPRVALIIDTSGSMSDSMVGQGIAEVDGLLQSFANKAEVTVYFTDVAVSEAQRVRSAAALIPYGGGGTDMRNGFAAIEEDTDKNPGNRPSVIVVVTDGYTPWPESAPRDTPVIIVLTADGEVPAWSRETPNAVIAITVPETQKA